MGTARWLRAGWRWTASAGFVRVESGLSRSYCCCCGRRWGWTRVCRCEGGGEEDNKPAVS
jgi:hypothetical protein